MSHGVTPVAAAGVTALTVPLPHESQGTSPQSHLSHADDRNGSEWTDTNIARFLEREARLLRWGWPAADAEALAERLVQRDCQRDDRVSCIDCAHYRPDRCSNHRAADLQAPVVARSMASLLQRCAGFHALARPPVTDDPTNALRPGGSADAPFFAAVERKIHE
ncbi:MAG: hypothetical protein ACOZD0_14480 [Pseudomonadota bacterium]